MTFAFPETGAASNWMPCASNACRNSAEPSSEIDEHSTTSFGRLPSREAFESNPAGPSTTSFTSSYVDTITKTISHAARSVTLSATLAPYCVKGSAFARVRFQTVTSAPPLARRPAIS